MDENSNSFLEVARSAMNEQGVSVSELARQLGCSRPWLSNVLAGKHDIKMSSVAAIADKLGLKVMTVRSTNINSKQAG